MAKKPNVPVSDEELKQINDSLAADGKPPMTREEVEAQNGLNQLSKAEYDALQGNKKKKPKKDKTMFDAAKLKM